MAKEVQQKQKRPKYLIAYNLLAFVLWMGLFINLIVKRVPPSTLLLSQVQALALLEVLHAVIGLVRASVLSTVLQVASRVFISFFICHKFSISEPFHYKALVFAWSLSEVVRYAYYLSQLIGSIPRFLQFARYNFFLLLYPIGAVSELLLINDALPKVKGHWHNGLLAVMFVWVPAFFYLFNHMLKQRRSHWLNQDKKIKTK